METNEKKVPVKSSIEVKKQNEGVVSVPKSILDALIQKSKDQEQKIEMLTEISDKARLTRYQSKHKEITKKKARVSVFNGKIVVGWTTVMNDVYQDEQGKWHEDQVMKIVLEDNTKKDLRYKVFGRIKKIDCTIMSRYTTPEGAAMMRISVMGKQIDIDEIFIN